MKIAGSSFLAICLSVSACGPGNADWNYPIVGGYYLADAGGDNKVIALDGDNPRAGIVIDARVDMYLVDHQQILVARRPWIPVDNGAIQSATLSPYCEYWTIDTVSHVVRKLDDRSPWPSLKCR